MTEAAAFRASYADFRLVKSRKQAQLIFEVPLEEADAAMAALGGLPRPDASIWVGICRLDAKATSEPKKAIETASERARQKWRELAPAKQAAIRCKEPAFQRFVEERYDGLANEESVTEFVREACGVKSRADILDGTTAAWHWRKIDGEYQAWLMV